MSSRPWSTSPLSTTFKPLSDRSLSLLHVAPHEAPTAWCPSSSVHWGPTLAPPLCTADPVALQHPWGSSRELPPSPASPASCSAALVSVLFKQKQNFQSIPVKLHLVGFRPTFQPGQIISNLAYVICLVSSDAHHRGDGGPGGGGRHLEVH